MNRLLRSNGYFVYSAPPAYKQEKDFPLIWDKLTNLTSTMCWKLISRKVQTAIWIKPENQSCLLHNVEQKLINICDSVDDSNLSWNTPLRDCITLSKAQSHSHNLPPRPQRLSEYSRTLGSVGMLKVLSLSIMECFAVCLFALHFSLTFNFVILSFMHICCNSC